MFNEQVIKAINMALSLVKFINIILAALLAGISFGIWIGFNPLNYSSATYLEQQQSLIHSLNALMFALVVLAVLTTLISAFLQRKDKPVFIALLLAAGFFLSCIALTRMGNIPLQSEMLNWTPDTLPDNWTMFRDKWWTYHIMRTVTELIALGLIAWTLVHNQRQNVLEINVQSS
jgi:hypothetical protein